MAGQHVLRYLCSRHVWGQAMAGKGVFLHHKEQVVTKLEVVEIAMPDRRDYTHRCINRCILGLYLMAALQHQNTELSINSCA